MALAALQMGLIKLPLIDETVQQLHGLAAVRTGREMAGKRILVVEDEFLIALDIAGALEQGGLVVIGPLASVGDALRTLESEKVDGALLDANLGGEPVGRVADALLARRVPFAFVSGYGREQLPKQHQGAPLIGKPFTGQDLLGVVARFWTRP